MKKTIIYGASDDCIELDGAICDEANHYSDDKPASIIASDGTYFRMEYTGKWEVTIKQKGDLFDRLVEGDGDSNQRTHLDDEINTITESMVPFYSDVVVFKPGLEWIKINGKKFKPTKR